MPLSFEQYKQLRAKGLSNDQIKRFEGGETPMAATNMATTKPPLKSMLSPTNVERGGSSAWDVAISTLQGMQRDISIPTTSFINQYLLQAPQGAAKSLGYEYPSEKDITSPIMKPLSYASGISSAFVNPLAALSGLRGVKAARNITRVLDKPVGVVIKKAPKILEMARNLPTGVKKWGGIALGGAGLAALYTPEEQESFLAPVERLKRAPFGAATALIAQPVIQGVGDAVKFGRRFVSKFKKVAGPETLAKLEQIKTQFGEKSKEYANALSKYKQRPSVDITQQPQKRIERAKVEFGKKQQPIIEEKRAMIEREYRQSKPFEKAKQKIGELKKVKTQDLSTKLSEQQGKLQTELDNIADANALNIKQKARDFRRNVKNNFKDTLEEVSSSLEAQDKNATANDIASWADDIANEAKNKGNLIDLNKPTKLKNDVADYLKQKFDLDPDMVVDDVLEQYGDTPIDFTWLKNRMGLVKKGIAKGRLAKGALGQEDLMEAGLHRRFSDWASSQSDEYAELLATSKKGYDVADKIDELAQTGKPYDREKMASYLKKYAEGKEVGRVSSGDEFLGTFEKGVTSKKGGIAGVGNVTKDVEMAQAKLSQFGKTSEEQIANLSKRYDDAAKKAGLKLDSLKNLNKEKMFALDKKLTELEKQLATREAKIRAYPKTGEKAVGQFKERQLAIRRLKAVIRYAAIAYGTYQAGTGLVRTGGRILTN